jgi:hypothetical protein
MKQYMYLAFVLADSLHYNLGHLTINVSLAHKCMQVVTDQKRAWLEAQELARDKQQLASWPQHLIEHFFVVVSLEHNHA